METNFLGQDRRKFVRLDYVTPLACKVCKKETLNRLLKGYTSNLSQTGILCNLKERVGKDEILWLSFDRGTLNICAEIEKNSLIYQGGIIGKVVRTEHKTDGSYNIGMRFITREESDSANIYPKVRFLNDDSDEHSEES